MREACMRRQQVSPSGRVHIGFGCSPVPDRVDAGDDGVGDVIANTIDRNSDAFSKVETVIAANWQN